jgi:hypothetical protein
VNSLRTSMGGYGVVIKVGELAGNLETSGFQYGQNLKNHYLGFVDRSERAEFNFKIELTNTIINDPDDEVSVRRRAAPWSLERGDFQTERDVNADRGTTRQLAHVYFIDAAVRIFHAVMLAKRWGFLLHAASVIRNGRACLLAGPSRAGKTMIAGLVPTDATLLTDEISHVRKSREAYVAFGTPFAGKLAQSGENASAPIALLCLLSQGPENYIEPVRPSDAVSVMLANVLFFVKDPELIRSVFRSACQLVSCVPVHRLTFVPDFCVWENVV